MHKDYARDGLVCMSVSLDEVKQRDKPLGFLKQRGATFVNYLLDEEIDLWQNKFDISGPPLVFVFDRDNQRAAKFDTSDPKKLWSYDDVEALVRKLLQAGK